MRSVTNIVGNIYHKPHMMQATGTRAAQRAVNEERRWTAIIMECVSSYAESWAVTHKEDEPVPLSAAKKWEEEGEKGAIAWIARAMPDYAKSAAAVGSAVHFACEHYEEHVIELDGYDVAFDDWLNDRMVAFAVDIDKPEAKAINFIRQHVVQYRKALDECGITVLDNERTVFHPVHAYAGTLDSIVEIGGYNYVMDIKTGGVYPESVSLQLAAYRYATHSVLGSIVSAVSGGGIRLSNGAIVPILGGCVLQLKPRSYHLHFVRCDELAHKRFLQALDLSEWKQNAEGLIGPHWQEGGE